MKEYVVKLDTNIMMNGEKLFTLEGAEGYVIWAESKYPENKGLYEIYKLVKVSQ